MNDTSAVRRRIMQAVRSKDTAPELTVRRLVTALGYKYRLHRPDLPGKPDLAFIGRRKAVFVHGCFWHGHDCPRGARVPKGNNAYWVKKIARNKRRDLENLEKMTALGWRTLVLWECELKHSTMMRQRLTAFLDAGKVGLKLIEL